MKKGQVLGQPFVFMFYLIVVVLILYFGIRVVANIRDTEREVDYATFINELNSKINTIRNDAHGSRISLEDVRVPNEVTEICFVMDSDVEPDDDQLEMIIDSYFDSPVPGQDNVFFAGKYASQYFEFLKIEENFCDLTSDGLDIAFENSANEVVVIDLNIE